MPKNPHANFSPVLDGYSGIGAFRFWCQTALPLTYDDSLSYYELLCKVVNYLNHTIEDLTNVENNTSELAEAYDKLQKYVNDYFDDIDIEAELRHVLDEMAEDGTLDALLDPLVAERLPSVVENQISNVVAEQIDDAVEGQIDGVVEQQLPPLVDANIGEEVSQWLVDNVNPVGSAVLVDSTLSISGAAADAKVTGDELSDLKTQLNVLEQAENDRLLTESTANMFDPLLFRKVPGISMDSDGYYCATALNLKSVFGSEAGGVPGLTFESNKQYAFNATVFSDSDVDSAGLLFKFTYDDETSSRFTISNNTPVPTTFSGVSTAGKTVTNFEIRYANGPSVTWHIKNLILAQSDTVPDFIPHLYGVDIVARQLADENSDDIDVLSIKQEDIISKMPEKTITIPVTWTQGFWNTQTDVAQFETYSVNYYASNAISVNPGKTYSVYIRGGTSSKQRPVVVVDSNYNVLYKCDAFSTIQTVPVTIPANGAYLLLTNYKSSGTGDSIVSTTELDNIPGYEDVRLNILKGKKVAIIGDSISTNGNPGSGEYPNAVEITVTEDDIGVSLSAYLTKFDVDAGLSLGGHTFTSSEIGTEVTFIPTEEDVGKVIGLPNNYNTNVTKVWWEVAMDEFGFTPIPVCWSGSSITAHEADSNTYKTSYAWHDAQIRKCGIRTPGTMDRTAPDVIIVYRGTNDFSHSPVTRLTENYPGGITWQYPDTDIVQTDKYGYKEGLCLLVKKLRQAYPNATIYFCTLNVFKRMNYENFPTRNSYNTLPEYNDAIRETARFLGIDVIDFANDGITFENCYIGGYITDNPETPAHPNDKGHAVMGKKAIADLLATYAPLS